MTQVINAALAAAIEAAKKNEDQSKVVAGGGEYTPPAAGPCFGRLVSYLELGKEVYDYKATPTSAPVKKTKDRVRLVFELIGKKHPPVEIVVDGVTIQVPVRMTLNVNKSFGENGLWRKLFAKLNHDGSITHAAERLGAAFKLNVVHSTKDLGGGKTATYANLTNAEKEYQIFPASIEKDDGEGNIELQPVTVGPALTELKCFLWDYATKEMWDSIFIDGSYPERKDDKGNITAPAKSKNVIQEEIKKASNFIGSPIYDIIAASGDELVIADAEQPARSSDAASDESATPAATNDASSEAAGDDPLAGV